MGFASLRAAHGVPESQSHSCLERNKYFQAELVPFAAHGLDMQEMQCCGVHLHLYVIEFVKELLA